MDLRDLSSLAKRIAGEIQHGRPPDDGVSAVTYQVLPPAVTRGTRGYIEKISNQINGAYEKGWFDACAVMMRRLLETVIIEAFEYKKIESKIKDKNGDYLYLSDLIAAAQTESQWTLTRNTKRALSKLKDVGDKSAHSRRYIAHREDVESLATDFRGAIQEFIFLAGLK